MFAHTKLRLTTLAVLLVGMLVAIFTAGYFGLEIITEILILAMLVVALDIVAGFGGMISLCHGALLGIGAYAYVLFSVLMGVTPVLAALYAILLTGALAWLIGAICSRSHGIYFIMATLAFGQMAYSYIFESPLFGGDDGMGGISRFDLSAIGVDLNDSKSFVLFCLVLLVLVYMASAFLLRSGLGRSLTGVMHNEQRMRALGLNVWRVKAAVFGLSGLIAGLAGVLSAQHVLYISPGLLSWTVSGEALVVVILGGLGTLVGPLIGAGVFVFMKHELSAITSYWHLVVGAVLIIVVISRANGIFGWLESKLDGRKSQKTAAQAPSTPAEEVANDA